ncbi:MULTISPECIES: ABC transporter ATP-binding protein [Kamptonema]|uniref:ABC transporter ATP-binding protein n=1 Tax=Kamptonema TaxID=1501433 RepID=UPI00030F33DB|nr:MULTISPECIES: ABC transporter ATP-binding protein [Kamptonema]
MKNTGIIVEGLGKRFSKFSAKKPKTIMEAALSGMRRLNPEARFWALRDVSFTVPPGKMLGVIGRNGAGKSTLLLLVGGIGKPDEGKIIVNPRIGGLLDLGAGFHRDLTGRENVFVGGVVAGLTRQEVARRFDDIVEFAEMGQFIDSPMRTYSTGMQMRLGFSVAVHTDPKVLLIDEFISVGDVAFQAKCLQRMSEIKSSGCAIMLVSQNPRQIEQLCDEAIWLKEGKILMYGDPKMIAAQYAADMGVENQELSLTQSPQIAKVFSPVESSENRVGTGEVEITSVRLLPVSEIRGGDPLDVEIEYISPEAILSPIFTVNISREDGKVCFDANTEKMQMAIPQIQGRGKIKLRIDRLDLGGGEYFVNVGVYKEKWGYPYDFHWQVYPLIVHAAVDYRTIIWPPCRWEISE